MTIEHTGPGPGDDKPKLPQKEDDKNSYPGHFEWVETSGGEEYQIYRDDEPNNGHMQYWPKTSLIP